jgi:hypothetical protein
MKNKQIFGSGVIFIIFNIIIVLGIYLTNMKFPISEANINVKEGLEFLMAPYLKELEKYVNQRIELKIEMDSEQNIVLENEKSIKGATLDKLIERLTYHTDMDIKFKDIFFLTYR